MSVAFKNPNWSNQLVAIANEISRITGNQFGEKQYSMIESRLKKRSLDLALPDLDAYFKYFDLHKTAETEHLVSLLTTHHTYFFREFTHFEYLEEKILPALAEVAKKRGDKKIKLWSAACSRGQEVYSLAMFLEYWTKRFAPDLTYEIFGSDIDASSVKYAQNGVYTRNEIKEIPLPYLGDHWAKGTGDIAEFVKVKNTLRSKTKWGVINFFEMPSGFHEKFDIIFCRNVFIYFNSTQIKSVSETLLKHLTSDGTFFLGVSETLNGLNLPLESIGPSIYAAKKSILAAAPAPKIFSKSEPSPVSTKPSLKTVPSALSASMPQIQHKEVLRILCVDDSPSILTILKNILTPQEGFEIVGTAANGKEAAEKVALLKPDAMTLDIHMPEQNGVEYLASRFNANHPPVIMVSSVSREDSDVALNALKLGASDYVEKPALNNFAEVGDQLKRKLRSAWRTKEHLKHSGPNKIDEQFKMQLKIAHPERGIRLIIGQMADLPRIQRSISEIKPGGPPTVILLDHSNEALADLSKSMTSNFEYLSNWKPLKGSQPYVGDLKVLSENALQHCSNYFPSIMIFGEPSEKNLFFISKLKERQVLIEDMGPKVNEKNPLMKIATDIMPSSGFIYTSDEYFSRKT